jgi:hypothetical protein
MEKSYTEHSPEIDPETRREIFEDLKTRIVDSLEKHPAVRASWFFRDGSDVELVSRSVSTPSGANYDITRNTNVEETEVTINRSGRRLDNPNIVLESIRFKFGRFGLRGQDPLLEYHRSLKNGGSRTLKNSLLAVRRMEEFIGEFSQELGTRI